MGFYALPFLAVLLASPSVASDEVRLGLSIPSYMHAVAWIAQERGDFKRRGLDVKIYIMKGSGNAAKALLSGSLDFALAGGDAAIRANLAGGDLVILAGLVNRFYHRLVVKSGIRTPNDLKGRSLALTHLGGPQETALKFALKRMGLDHGKDVTIKNAGLEFNRLAMLHKGYVDGITTDAPLSLIRKLGFRVLADLRTWEDAPFPYMVLMARKEIVDEKGETAERLLAALCDAMVYYRSHKEESLKILSPYLPAGPDDDAGEFYDDSGPGMYSDPPYPDLRGLQVALDIVAEDDSRARALKPEGLVDPSLMRRLKASGQFAPPSGRVPRHR